MCINVTDYNIRFKTTVRYNVETARKRNVLAQFGANNKRQIIQIFILLTSADRGNKHTFFDLLLLAKVDGKWIDAEKLREEADTFMLVVEAANRTALSLSTPLLVVVYVVIKNIKMIVMLLVVISVLLLLVNWIKMIIDSYKINVSGPFPLPLLGNAHMFLVDTSEFVNLLHKFTLKYGDAFRAHFFSNPYVFLSHPKYVEPLVSSSELITKGRSYRFLYSWLGEGLLTSTGQRWKNHRKFLTPAFHFNILQNFIPVFCKNQRVLTEKLRKLADGKNIDMFPIVALTALDNVTESIMGVFMDTQQHDDSEYVKSIEVLAYISSLRIQVPFLHPDFIFNILPLKTKQDKALKVVHSQTQKVIKVRQEELNKANVVGLDAGNDIGIRNKHAFLDLLLLAEVDGKRIDAEKVREEVDTFMFEGHDTTTSGIVYTLYILSKHRDVQEKIYEELKTIFGDDMNRDPTYKELHQMKYLELVLKESMRLYPPVPLIERLMVKDCEVGDLKLVKGTSVMINIFQIQRKPELYDDPLEFRPERFEGPLKNPFNWLAFSAGPRNCIGQKFAMMELKVTISEMIKKFVILPSGLEPQATANLVLKSNNGVHIRLKPRLT